MAPITAGSPFRPRSRGPRARSSSPPPLPPKSHSVELGTPAHKSDSAAFSFAAGQRQAYLCDVVVDHDSPETTALVGQLGTAVEPVSALPRPKQLPSTPGRKDAGEAEEPPSQWSASKQDELDKRLRALIEELVRTERSYVLRIRALKTNYADPLRHFAKSPSTSIIPVYEAKTLFGNIDAILPAAQAFLSDLESMWESGHAINAVGEICLKHTLKTLDPYRSYIANQDESQKTFQEMFKKHSRFVSFIDSTKYQTTGIGNIGLRELLMEPVQRVPRYTLLWQSMAKCMAPISSQRAKLLEATDVASRIARCDADEQTVRATVMYCLQRNVEGFPANLFSNNRNYLDSIDVEDLTTDGVAYLPRSNRPLSMRSGKSGTASSLGSLAASTNSISSPQKEPGAPTPLHCTLFLFDDKLMVTKRQLSSVSGRQATGLDDIRGLIKSGGGIAVKEKDGVRRAKLSFRGVVDILDVSAVEGKDGDFQLYFAKPITDQSERWTLPLRSFSACHPPYPLGSAPQAAREDKTRFVQNIWAAQALARTKILPSQTKAVPYVLRSVSDIDTDRRLVRAFWNVWTPSGLFGENFKAKVLVQVVSPDCQTPIPQPNEQTPLVIRLEALEGDLCRFSYQSIKGDPISRVLIDSNSVAKSVVEAASSLGTFALPASNPSPMMQTPTLNKRASRMLFSAGTGSSRGGGSTSGDGFGSSSTKRSRSIASHASTLDNSRCSSETPTLSSNGHGLGPTPPGTPKSSRSPTTPTSVRSPTQPENGHATAASSSDSTSLGDNLEARLEEARGNTRLLTSMASPQMSPAQSNTPSRVAAMRNEVEARERKAQEEFDWDARAKARPVSPVKAGNWPSPIKYHTETPSSPSRPAFARSPIVTQLTRESSVSSSLSKSPSRCSMNRSGTLSPRGPRSPHGKSGYLPPLPPPIVSTGSLPRLGAAGDILQTPSLDVTSAVEGDCLPTRGDRQGSPTARKHNRPWPELSETPAARSNELGTSGSPRPLSLMGKPVTDENTLPGSCNPNQKRHHPAEHLSPRKRSPSDSPIFRRDGEELTPTQSRNPRYPSSLSASSRPGSSRSATGRGVTPRRGSRSPGGALTPSRRVSSVTSIASNVSGASTSTLATVCTLTSAIDQCDVVMSDHPDLSSAAESARQQIGDARKQTRLVRKKVTAMRRYLKELEQRSRTDRASSLARSPTRLNIHTELLAPENRDGPVSSVFAGKDLAALEELARNAAVTSDSLDSLLSGALADTERVRMLARQAAEHSATVAQFEAQVARAREREDLLRGQLASKDMELEEIYNAFNLELDGMYNDITLPTPDNVQAALRRDLQQAKASRNELALENQRLRDQLAKERLRREQMANVLRVQGTAMSVDEDDGI